MTRPVFLLALILTVLFASALGIIRAQPYDDSALDALLAPEDCEMPCFMGIRPGVTTYNETISILEAAESIDTVIAVRGSQVAQFSRIRWRWKPGTPHLTDGTIRTQNGVVHDIQLTTTFSPGDLWLTLGWANLNQVAAVMNSKPPIVMVYINSYPQHKVWVTGYVDCPYFPSLLWRSNIDIVFSAEPKEQTLSAAYDHHTFLSNIIDYHRAAC